MKQYNKGYKYVISWRDSFKIGKDKFFTTRSFPTTPCALPIWISNMNKKGIIPCIEKIN